MAAEKTDTTIIFDFDGTIADSFLTTIQEIYKVAHPNELLPEEDISRLRAMTMYQLSRALHIPWWRILFLTRRVRRLMRIDLSEIMPITGMESALRKLSKRYKLFVLSSNSTSNIQSFLRRNEIDTCFSGIFGNASPLTKKRKLARLIEQFEIDKQHAWYVGDERLDVRAAKHVGIRAIAVSWGYSNIHVLERQRHIALVFSPEELCTLFNTQ